MWCYSNAPPDKPIIIFQYQHSRAGEHAKTFLDGFKGHVQCDGYSGYHWLALDRHKTRGGCMAHARRKFVDVIKIKQQTGLAQQAIDRMAKLYAIEKTARENHDSFEQRYQRRQEKAKPILSELKQWLDTHVIKVLPRSKLGEAFTYIMNQWPQLIMYLNDGRYEIDNNRVENLIRPFALGRKNWLFMGSPRGAHAGALFYTLIATAKANQLSPFGYLRYVFERICQSQ